MDFPGLELFLDDLRVACTRNLRRQVVRPVLHAGNPVLRREHPWEASHVAAYGGVYQDPETQRWRLWYNAFGESYYDQQVLAYAESADGVEWDKPQLAVRTWPGRRGPTNILFGPECNVHGPGVIPNPDPDARDRWLLLFDSYPKFRPDAAPQGITGRWSYAAASPDGLHWTPERGRPAFAGKADSAQCVLWDPAARVFRAYSRLTTVDAFGQRIRTFRSLESTDFQTWDDPREVFRPDAEDGAPDTQLQSLALSLYDGIYVGFVTLFRISRYVVSGDGRHVDEGVQVDASQLVTSRDGLRLDRVAGRQKVFEPSSTGFGVRGYRLAPHLVVHGDEVRIYLSGHRPETGGGLEIGLATLGKDRFVALVPERLREAALVELVPMRYAGGAPRLNAEVGPTGRIRAEVADMNGATISGYSKDEAVAVTGDALDHELRWQRRGADYGLETLVEDPRQRPVRLRLWLEQARVHALRAT